MKSGLSTLMLIIILLPGLCRLWMVVDFKINQDFIAKVLCINKDEPTPACNGGCYLSTRLKKADDLEKKQFPQESLKKITDITLFSEQIEVLLFSGFQQKENPHPYCSFSLPIEYPFSVFHPPKVLIHLVIDTTTSPELPSALVNPIMN